MAGFLTLSFMRRSSNIASIFEFPVSSLFIHRRLSVGQVQDQSHSEERFKVELVDDEAWKLTTALSHTWRHFESRESHPNNKSHDAFDFDEIEEMRLRKSLFYKLDRGSIENKECSSDLFSRQKSKSNKESKIIQESKNSQTEKSPREGKIKRERIPTFNQSTEAYHLPFCLDIFISKGSVRVCIVHRSTSKVVSVAHSISKDMKLDLSSRKDRAACAAVGSVLAQRALSDDIHNVVYIPRRGVKIEGKLQVVVQSIVDAGIDVKIKTKSKLKRKMNPG